MKNFLEKYNAFKIETSKDEGKLTLETAKERILKLLTDNIRNFKEESWNLQNRMNKLIIDTEKNSIFTLRLGGKRIVRYSLDLLDTQQKISFLFDFYNSVEVGEFNEDITDFLAKEIDNAAVRKKEANERRKNKKKADRESVLLDELMRQDKIELHFYREGMILNSKSTSADIMRWDFSVMGAKAYVLQLSENVRRSTELKIKNGERCGVAPLGYENYVDERGKHTIRLKEPEAGIIKQIFELYSLGKMSILEAVHFADLMGLKTRAGKKLVNSSIYYILDNPFYYGEMKTKRGIIKHVYPPLISQELWEQCQKQKALNNHNGAGLKYSQKPFVLRGLITCGRTGRVCPCEDQLRRKYYSWVVCYTKTGQRRYIPEQDVLSAIETVLNRIKIPDSLINPLYEEIKNAEISEKQYCQQEIGKLRQEQEKLKAKLDNLFDLRLDGELDRETFETKRNEIQLKIDRIGRKIKTYEKTGNAFTSTILDLINLASQAGRVFAKSDHLELKHLLLKFVFKEMILTEGELTYELNFPFSEFEKAYFYEKRSRFLQGSQNEENQGLEDNKTDENAKSFGPKIAFKNQRVASKNATLLQSG